MVRAFSTPRTSSRTHFLPSLASSSAKHNCKSGCPPCDKVCPHRCVHNECAHKCGDPCAPCKMRCAWACPHSACSRTCGEPCDRKACDLPCPKTLECGHPCIGVCGEPCPPLCRVCNPHAPVTDSVMFGAELGDADLVNMQFVYLPDCKHVLEREGFDGYMNAQVRRGQEQQRVRGRGRESKR